MTHQNIAEGEPLVEGFPIRDWYIEVYLVDSKGNLAPANIFDKVTYHLHPTFVNPTRVLKKPPFRVEERGWGGFELGLTLTFVDKAGDRKLSHDLSFEKNDYTVDHVLNVPVTKGANLRRLLLETGDVPDVDESAAGDKRKLQNSYSGAGSNLSKRSKLNTNSISAPVKGSVDLEKLAENLLKLSEDDLVGVVQMVSDNKTSDMSIKNDVEEGEFTMDLFTLPDGLLKSLWEYVKKRTD